MVVPLKGPPGLPEMNLQKSQVLIGKECVTSYSNKIFENENRGCPNRPGEAGVAEWLVKSSCRNQKNEPAESHENERPRRSCDDEAFRTQVLEEPQGLLEVPGPDATQPLASISPDKGGDVNVFPIVESLRQKGRRKKEEAVADEQGISQADYRKNKI